MFEIFAIASAIFGGASIVEGQKANRRARRAADAQRRMENLRAAKERSHAVRDMRIAFAAAENSQANSGVLNAGASAQGGLDSIITQGNSNISFLDKQKALADLSGKWLDSAAKAESASKMFAGLSSLSMSAAGVDWNKVSSDLFPTQSPAPIEYRTGRSRSHFGQAGTLSRTGGM